MFVSKVTFQARLAENVGPNDTRLTLCDGAAKQLDAIGAGNYFYMLIRGPNRREVVRYVHALNYDEKQFPDEIIVDRAVEGGNNAFGRGDCVTFVWTSDAIVALIKETS